MQLEEKISVLEAILFASGEPISEENLSIASGVELETLHKTINLLNDKYETFKSALIVKKLENSYQLMTRDEFFEHIKLALETKRSVTLSPAAMEVLTIIAYNQPVTKGFVESVRGIDSASVVNSLVEKDLLEEAGRLDVPGRPIAYKTTTTFLRSFQISSIDELPQLSTQNEQITFDEVSQDESDINALEQTACEV